MTEKEIAEMAVMRYWSFVFLGIGPILKRTQMGTFRPCVYTGPAGNVPNGTASRTQMGPLTKAIPFGTVPRKVLCKRVGRFQTGTARK